MTTCFIFKWIPSSASEYKPSSNEKKIYIYIKFIRPSFRSNLIIVALRTAKNGWIIGTRGPTLAIKFKSTGKTVYWKMICNLFATNLYHLKQLHLLSTVISHLCCQLNCSVFHRRCSQILRSRTLHFFFTSINFTKESRMATNISHNECTFSVLHTMK